MKELKGYRPKVAPKVVERGPNPAIGALVGAAGGAGAALAMCGVEWAVTGWIGLGAPAGDLAAQVAALAAGTGAVCGGAVGAVGARGGRWALGTLGLLGGWLVSGRLAASLEEAGGSPVGAPLVAVVVGAALAFVAATAITNERARSGLALGVGAWLALALPVNQHLIGAPMSSLALSVDLLLALGALLVGVASAFAVEQLRGVMSLIVLANVVAWAAAVPKLGPPALTWPAPGAASGPPIVLIVVDTLRADRLGYAGHSAPTSPTIDALARTAVVYEEAHATAPWTLPSTASLLTGRLPTTHGAGLHDGRVNQRSALRSDVATLAERLRAVGYNTAGVASNPWTSAAYGFHRGFQVWDDASGSAPMPAFLHPFYAVHLDPLAWPLYRNAEDVTDAALDFLADRSGEGWFLFVQYMDVHGPLRPTDADRKAVGAAADLAGEYDAAIHRVDRNLARLLSALPDRAVVVLTSDHGEELDEKRAYRNGVPLGTRHGHHLHQELLRVPLLVAGLNQRPMRVKRPVSLVDVAPSLLRIAGAAPFDGADGQPLAECFGEAGVERPIRAEALRYGPEQQALRAGHLKFVRDAAGAESLFDLRRDPDERLPIGRVERQFTEVVPAMRGALPQPGGGAAGNTPTVGAELRVLLERLGYVDAEEPAAP